MKVGIIGCGAIANIITTSIVPEDNGIELAYFFDKDIERAENLASFAGGVASLDFDDMVDNVDLVLECASPDSVRNFAPRVLKKGRDMIIMSIGAFMDMDFYQEIEQIAKENKAVEKRIKKATEEENKKLRDLEKAEAKAAKAAAKAAKKQK